MPDEADAGKPPAGQPDRPAEQTLPVADYQGARVLLVDDDVRNLLALTPLLERWGLDVMAAAADCNARSCLFIFSKFSRGTVFLLTKIHRQAIIYLNR